MIMYDRKIFEILIFQLVGSTLKSTKIPLRFYDLKYTTLMRKYELNLWISFDIEFSLDSF